VAQPVSTRNVKVLSPEGLHLRSASAIAAVAKRWNADIVIRKGDQRANAVNVLEIITLFALEGDELVIEATGTEAELAVEAVAKLFENGFEVPSEATEHCEGVGFTEKNVPGSEEFPGGEK
jgi:phosphotransferase system HPr (HPr) family protein